MDGAEIGAVHEKVGSERVTESVRRDMLSNTSGTGVFFYDTFYGAWGKTTKIARSIGWLKVARIVEKESGERIVTSAEIITDTISGVFGNKNRSVFATFSADDEFTAIEIDRITI